jgi:hypothetical protein
MNAQMTTTLSNPSTTAPPLSLECVRQRLRRANLYGLLAQAEQILHEPWLAHVLEIEESERQRRSLRRRLDGTPASASSSRSPTSTTTGPKNSTARSSMN